jgi:hypothetical protein
VIDTTRRTVADSGVGSLEEARLAGPLVAFSSGMKTRSGELKKFLFAQLYRHPQVMHTTGQAQQVVRELFEAYVTQPYEMPTDFAASANLHRSVAMGKAAGIDHFAMIHDSYGTWAADTPVLARTLRETFVDMFGGEKNLLKEFTDEVLQVVHDPKKLEEVPELPELGSLEVDKVLESEFFFA